MAKHEQHETEDASKLSTASRPGGYFIGTDGKPHDAHGKLIVEAADESVDYEGMTKDELQAEADKRGLTVDGSGANGNVVKADLVKALEAAQ